MHSIGETARASGLSVSALRFYDAAGVLVPVRVDPVNGYRWYSVDQITRARLIAGLRRVGMPLADIVRVLGALPDTRAVRGLLDAHLRRLEAGLADARRELSRVHALLDFPESHMSTRVSLSTVELAAALDSVRFAVGDDAELPMLLGVLLEAGPDGVWAVATDRYRMAVHHVPGADVAGPTTRGIAPASFVDRLRPALEAVGTVVLTLSVDRVSAIIGATELTAEPLDHEFPDFRRLLPEPSPAVRVSSSGLRDALYTAPSVVREHGGKAHAVVVLTKDCQLVGEREWAADADAHVAVNREFLLQALAAGGDGQLALELDGPIRPLVVRRDEHAFSLLMPIKR